MSGVGYSFVVIDELLMDWLNSIEDNRWREYSIRDEIVYVGT